MISGAILACELVVGFLAAVPVSGIAQEHSDSLRVVAVNLTAKVERRQTPEGAEAPRSRPGDLIEYRLLFINTAEMEVRDVEFFGPIPGGLVYLVGSAGGSPPNVAVDFSIDGGGTYEAEPEVEGQVNGRTVLLPAPAESYTHIRWTVQGTVYPGEEIPAAFRARIVSRSVNVG